MTVLARARVVLEGDTIKLTKAMRGAEAAMVQAGARMQEIGGRLTQAFTLPLAASLGFVGKAFIDFESSFAGIRKTMDLTEEQFNALSQANRDLAQTIPVSVNELNRIGELAGQLGVRGVSNVLKFEDTIAKLAVTTDMTADQGALAFAQVANIMGLPQGEIDRLGSAVVGLGNNFQTVESQIVDFTQRIAGAGKIAGLSVADVAGIGAAFASVGVEAEAGGTAIQKVLIDMTAAVTLGGENLAMFARTAGMSAADFKTAFERDASDAFTAFVNGLGKQGNQAIATLEEMGFVDQRLTRAFLSVAGAGDLLNRAVALSNTAFTENNALSEEASKRFQTAASQLRIFWNSIQDVAITIGSALVPILVDALKAMQPVMDFVKGMAEGFASLPRPVQAVALALTVLAAAAGPVVFGLGLLAQLTPIATTGLKLLTSVIGNARAFLSLATSVRNVSSAVALFQATLGPVGLAVAGVGAAIAAGIYVWKRWGDDIKLIVRATVAVVQERLRPLVAFVRAIWEHMVEAAVWFKDNALIPVKNFVLQVGQWLVDKLGPIIVGAAKMFGKVANFIVPGLGDALSAVGDFVGDVRTKMDEMRRDALVPATEAIVVLTNTIAEVPQIPPIVPPTATVDTEAVTEAVKALRDGLRDAIVLNKLYGDSFDLTRAQADAYGQAVRALVSAGVSLDTVIGPQGETLRELADKYLDLEASIKQTEDRTRAFEDTMQRAMSAVEAAKTPWQEYVETMRDLSAAFDAGRISLDQFAAAQAHAAAERIKASAPPKAKTEAGPDFSKEIGRVLQAGGGEIGQVVQAVASFGPLGLLLPIVTSALETLHPVLESLMEPLKLVGEIVGNIVAPILEMLAEPMRLVADLLAALAVPLRFTVFLITQQLKPALSILSGVLKVVTTVFSYLMEALGTLVKAIGKAIDKLPFVSAKGVIRTGEDMIKQARDARNGMKDVGEAAGEAADGLQTLGEALDNVPHVFALAARRFQSSMISGSAPGEGYLPEGGGGVLTRPGARPPEDGRMAIELTLRESDGTTRKVEADVSKKEWRAGTARLALQV